MTAGRANGTCGYLALAALGGRSPVAVATMLRHRFGTDHISGREMREIATAQGWAWTNMQGRHRADLPQTGRYLVVTRRGFYALIDGVPNLTINAPLCGYYSVPVRD